MGGFIWEAVKEPVTGRAGAVREKRATKACAKALRLWEASGHAQGAARPVWLEHTEREDRGKEV